MQQQRGEGQAQAEPPQEGQRTGSVSPASSTATATSAGATAAAAPPAAEPSPAALSAAATIVAAAAQSSAERGRFAQQPARGARCRSLSPLPKKDAPQQQQQQRQRRRGAGADITPPRPRADSLRQRGTPLSESEVDSDALTPSRPGSRASAGGTLLSHHRRRRLLGPTRERGRCKAKLARYPRPGAKDDTLWLQYRDDNGDEGRLDVEHDVCALSVSLFAAPSRAEVEGQILIVPKAKSLNRSEWGSWVHMFLLNVSMFLCFGKVLGPVTAALMITATIGLREEIDTILIKDHKLTPEQVREVKAVVGVVALAVNLSAYSPTWTVALLVVAAVVVLALIKRDVFVLPSGFRYTSPTRPIVLTFEHQRHIHKLLAFRQQVKAEPAADAKMKDVVIGSYYVETALSVLLYHEVYNSLRVRRLAHFFVVFALPIIFAFQVLHTFGPRILLYLSRLQRSVEADYGVRAARSLAYVLHASNLLPGPPEVGEAQAGVDGGRGGDCASRKVQPVFHEG